jgi:transformation/transcription domain-associated protein
MCLAYSDIFLLLLLLLFLSQSSLRPVLLNLAHFTKLTVPLLNGIARLLELLTNCFNVALGDKLIEHLGHICSAAKPKTGSPGGQASNTGEELPAPSRSPEDIKVAACIIDIFRLLPTQSVKFLKPLVESTLELEKLARQPVLSSRYRPPLFRFLARYPAETVELFLSPAPPYPRAPALFLHALNVKIDAPVCAFDADSESRASAGRASAVLRSFLLENAHLLKDLLLREAGSQQAGQTDQIETDQTETSQTDQAGEKGDETAETAQTGETTGQTGETGQTGQTGQGDGDAMQVDSGAVVPEQTARGETDDLSLERRVVAIVNVLVKNSPEESAKNEVIFELLKSAWGADRRRSWFAVGDALGTASGDSLGSVTSLADLHDTRKIARCLWMICREHHRTWTFEERDLDLVFDLLLPFCVRSTVNLSFLDDFFAHEIPLTWRMRERKMILERFVDFYGEDSVSPVHKVLVMRKLIRPLLAASTSRPAVTMESRLAALTCCRDEYRSISSGSGLGAIPDDVLKVVKGFLPPNTAVPAGESVPMEVDYLVSDELLSKLVHVVLNSRDSDANHADMPQHDALSIELLNLAALLVTHMKSRLVDLRKELIKFAWIFLKADDCTTKHCAYKLVCHFIKAFDTPPKIILQVYVSLLRAYQPEARILVKEVRFVVVVVGVTVLLLSICVCLTPRFSS